LRYLPFIFFFKKIRVLLQCFDKQQLAGVFTDDLKISMVIPGKLLCPVF